jgi:hypothetical protein
MTIQLGRRRFELRRGITGFLIMIAALIAFEVFNFSTTEYALSTFFGAHNALGMVSWATVLASLRRRPDGARNPKKSAFSRRPGSWVRR